MTPVDTRSQFDDVWGLYWPIALAVFVAVALALLALVVRYRSSSRQIPRGRDRHQPLEVAYAVALACVAALLVYLSFSHMPGGSDAAAKGPPLRVNVTAARWNWRFEYPAYGAVEQGTRSRVPALRVPVSAPIEFSGGSLDVIHSFWVPEQRFKRDLFPHRTTHWEMVFAQVGNWQGGGECAEFCGLEHAQMVFDVVAMPRPAFEAWARSTG